MTDITPRWLAPEEAARYISVRVDELPRLEKAGKLPSPSFYLGPRKRRYDRLQIDALFGPGNRDTVQEATDAAIHAILAKKPHGKKAAG